MSYYHYQEEIISELRSSNCLLFIGSGLSEGAGLKSWKELIKLLAEKIKCSMNYDFLTIAQVYEQENNRASLFKEIYNATETCGITPSKAHKLLPKLGVNTWITTNYDDLLEKTLDDEECPYRYHLIIRGRDIPTASSDRIVLIKLHGDRRDQKTIVVTKNDYFIAPVKKKIIWHKVEAELYQKTILFLGYSVSDPDFNQLQAQVLYKLGPTCFRKSYAIMFGVNEIIRKDLASRNIVIIDLGEKESPKEKTNSIHEFLTQIVVRLSHLPKIPPEYHDAY